MTPVVHILAPSPTVRVIRSAHCPTCERRSWFLCKFYAWYGWRMLCLRCADEWSDDGERADRPFARGWKAARLKQWKTSWRAGN